MILNTDPARLIDLASAVLFVALGAWILSLRPRRTLTTALAAFSMTLGGTFVASNLFAVGTGYHQAAEWVSASFSLAAAVCLVALSLLVPAWPTHRERGAAATAALGAGAVAAAAFLASGGWIVSGALPIARSVLLPAFWFAMLLLPLRCRLSADAGTRRSLALMAGALALYPAVYAGARMVYGSDGGRIAMGFPGMAVVLAAATLWIVNTTRSDSSRAARNAALVTLAAACFGMTAALFVGESLDGPQGAARTISVLIITYAILRHQLLGLDVKVRWGISKTAVAATFVAVFFVVSEAAQEFFGDALGSQYVGILAAGALVFAMAPLSRVADRLAEKAVPQAVATEAGADPEREEIYRKAVRLALRDRQLTRNEERDLFRLARGLGIEADRAHEILGEIESLDEESA